MNASAQSTILSPRLAACPLCNSESPAGRKALCTTHQQTIQHLTALALTQDLQKGA